MSAAFLSLRSQLSAPGSLPLENFAPAKAMRGPIKSPDRMFLKFIPCLVWTSGQRLFLRKVLHPFAVLCTVPTTTISHQAGILSGLKKACFPLKAISLGATTSRGCYWTRFFWWVVGGLKVAPNMKGEVYFDTSKVNTTGYRVYWTLLQSGLK